MRFGLPRRLKRYGLVLILGAVLAVSLAACNAQLLRNPTARTTQIITSTLGDPKTFNYALNQEFPHVFLFIYEGLVDQDGVTGDIIPALAESWQVSPDRKRVTYTLREGLKWSDGQPLTADDVVFTYNDVYMNPKIPTDEGDGLKIGASKAFPKVRKLDDRRVEFELPEPFSPILRTLSSPILPAHSLRESLTKTDSEGKPLFLSTWGTDTDPRKIIGNGPYVMESYTTSQRVIFRENPHYWRKNAQGEALPAIKRFVWQLVENTDTQLLQFRSGSLDALGLTPKEFSLLKQEEKRGDFRIYQGGPRSGTSFISFNLNQAKNAAGKPLVDPIKLKWFTNKAFRQAVAYAIDRPKMLNNVFRGIGELQNSPVSVQSPYFLKPEEGLKTYDYNPEKAKQLLKDAGFKYDSRGQLLDADGNRVRFTLITNAEARIRVEMAAQIKQDLAAIGMQVDFNPISFATLTEKLSTSRDWECYLLGFTGGVEPHNGVNVWTSTGGLHSFNQSSRPGQPPINGWVATEWEKEIDRLFEQGAREFDDAKRKQIYGRFQQIVQEELPAIHLITPTALSAIRNRVENVKFSGLDSRGSLWNIYELSVKD